MKKLLFVLIVYFAFIYSVNALTGTVNVNDSLNMRNAPKSNGDYIMSLYNNAKVNILNTNAGSENGCSDNWYQISYNDKSGYVCGTYIVIDEEIVSNVTEDDSYIRSNYDTSKNTIMCYEDTEDLSLRSTPGGAKVPGAYAKCGTEVTIEDVYESSSNSRCDYYYKINNGTHSGYVCGYFVNTTTLTPKAENYYKSNSLNETKDSYASKLAGNGFPDGYIPYLLEVHARHPNWNFISENINLNFDDVIAGENGNGASLLQVPYFDLGYLSLNSNTFDILNDKFSSYPGEGSFTNASKEAIAYYMDPRNYLNYKYIFAFETLEYSDNQNADIVNSILGSQGFWRSLYTDGSLDASNDVVRACKEIKISATHVAARIKQEVSGLDTSDSRIGGLFTYNGENLLNYYNFFNIKSNCTNCSSIYAGYAYEHGWDTPYKSIYGGAAFMYNGYISVNQDTLYYEKFDVSTNNGNYTHQYMQNLAAPIQEGGTKYNGYVSGLSDYLNTSITFVIPVYNNMPTYAVTAPKVGSPNNYLKDIKIDGKTVNQFSYNTYNYNVHLGSSTSSVVISASAINSFASISGIGKVNISSNDQTSNIYVTAANGKVRKYTITFTRDEDSSITTTEAMNNSGFKYNDNYVFGISIGTNVSSFVGNISSYNNSVKVSITDTKGNVKTNDIFKTGDIITVQGSDEKKIYKVLIYGDVNGDGKISSGDYVLIKNHIMNKKKLSDVYAKAADVNKDGKISSGDYVLIRNHIMGKSSINQ